MHACIHVKAVGDRTTALFDQYTPNNIERDTCARDVYIHTNTHTDYAFMNACIHAYINLHINAYRSYR